MSVSKAVEARKEAAAEPSLATVVRQQIQAQSTAFAAVLPRQVDPERFARLVLTAVKANPDLVQCFRTNQGQVSVMIAAMQAAALGLDPNTPTQDAWILPRKNKGVAEAQLMIGYRGLLKLCRRAGSIKTISAEVVREGDTFSWGYGLEADHFEHIPAAERGDLTHAYAIARYLNGGYNFVVLDRAAVEQRREMSASWGGTRREQSPWSTWPEAMWRKSALRALMPFLELTPEAAQADALDERPLAFDPEAGAIVAADGWAELPAATEDGEPTGEVEPWDKPAPGPDPIDAEVVEEENPPLAALAELYAAGQRAGLWESTTGLGTVRKRLLAAAAEHCGATYATPEELAADQVAVELLLAKLTPAAE